MTLCARPSDSDDVFISVKMVLQGYSEAVIYWCEKTKPKDGHSIIEFILWICDLWLLCWYSEAFILSMQNLWNTVSIHARLLLSLALFTCVLFDIAYAISKWSTIFKYCFSLFLPLPSANSAVAIIPFTGIYASL